MLTSQGKLKEPWRGSRSWKRCTAFTMRPSGKRMSLYLSALLCEMGMCHCNQGRMDKSCDIQKGLFRINCIVIVSGDVSEDVVILLMNLDENQVTKHPREHACLNMLPRHFRHFSLHRVTTLCFLDIFLRGLSGDTQQFDRCEC